MFGYVVADRSRLDEAQNARYRESYCGLCQALRRRHGQVSRLCLTYDMTFLLLLLDSLYEPETERGSRRCPVHPLRKQPWRTSTWADYAADMNVALAYYNCLDDWQDDRSLEKLAYAGALNGAFRSVRQSRPEQCAAIEKGLRQLSELEQADSADLDGAGRAFGQLMGSLFAVGDDFWKPTLFRLGDSLGRFIYVMDAVLDEAEDRKRGNYNPVARFRAAYGGFDAKGSLTLLIGDCADAYERLPLVQDKDLLDNILYHGVWNRWSAAHAKSTEKENRKDKTDTQAALEEESPHD